MDAIGPSFHDELEITQSAAVRSVRVGLDAGLANRFTNVGRGFIDQGMMDAAVGRMHDAMAAGLEEPDLGILGLAADGESGAMTMAPTRQGVHGRLPVPGGARDLAQPDPGLGWQCGIAKAWTAGAGGSMGAVVVVGHAGSLAF